MKRLNESRWFYIILSILLAVVFWMYVRTIQDTADDFTIYAVPVQVTNTRVLNERGLTVASVSPASVRVVVNAPISVRNNLNNNNVTATVDVSSITEAGTYELPCTPRVP